MARKKGSGKRQTEEEAGTGRVAPVGAEASRSDVGGTDSSGSGRRPRPKARLAWAALLVLAVGAVALALFRAYGPAGRRGPIILVSIDTLRADRLPAYGYRKVETPAIDALAAAGTVFENAYAHVPLTLPSHTSILTGLLPPAHGVRNNIGFKVAKGARTLATDLKGAGYSTGGAVSSWVLHATTGISQGFDWYDDEMKAAGPEVLETEIQREGTETVDRALAWLAEASKGSGFPSFRKRPVFLFVHIYEPHTPYAPPQRFLSGDRAPYDGEVMYADEIVGRLFAGLRRLDLWDPSLVVLLSDHGEGLDDHGEADHGVFLYREVMRVPLVVKLPGSRGGGRRIEAPVQLVDVAPTILEQAGLTPRAELAGTSLLGALRGEPLAADRRAYAESMYGRLHFGWKELFSMTGAGYSFILAPRPELYDVRGDPAQKSNLLATPAAGRPATDSLPAPVALEYEALHRALKSAISRARLAAPAPVDEEEVRKLRALGYLGSPTLDASTDDSAPDPKDRIGDLALFHQAVRLKKAHFHAKAVEALQAVVKASPRMLDAWDELSDSQLRLGRLDLAAEALEQSLRVSPARGRPRLSRVDILTQLRRFDEARRELQLAASHAPEEAATRLAILELVAGRPDAAREAVSRAAKGLPAAIPFIEGLQAYGEQEFSKSIASFRKALAELGSRSPRALPSVHYYLGDALAREPVASLDEAARQKVREEAEANLRIELKLNPTNSAAVTSLCYLHAVERDAKKVHQDLNDFARENPSVATFELIADLYRRMQLNDLAGLWSERARREGGRP